MKGLVGAEVRRRWTQIHRAACSKQKNKKIDGFRLSFTIDGVKERESGRLCLPL